ncbi:MAG: hypothetical protein COU07_04160 [Candidatus Harrisonbacteria bacterium CG10_big_fil_rev_8_21_14_0_10_40_38]|uniref:Uncharacterized protein n=1 Tax=Candidatus Harrisonbacteria bacterium CG10_big_fil_rev_8_21_14_0_10_40_38 TaxID=1974583 RepID=A0A2H0UST3_9BACT|nr:MAG: hypothetical protein COU07_04160 [Candidatus Harrisonbacteria bacterium CG10_big_fil_rev_8_21_14_0_10_40_38]
MKKILIVSAAILTSVAVMPLFAAFEAHVINVTAEIENALFVHPESLRFGTVFPQEYLKSSFFIAFSESFSRDDQRRVGTVEYVIKQKPKPREDTPEERTWCHDNEPENIGDPNDPYYDRCYPLLCAYLSKEPDGTPEPGNDTGVPPFHDPNDPSSWAIGKLVKFDENGNTIGNDPADTWTVDLAVPCFEGHCAQDWADFVHSHNPDADPNLYKLPNGLEHEVFGCDLWVEVTSIH